jgi:hypothetical protein
LDPNYQVAIANTLFGDNDRLGGKMPFTTYPISYIEKVKMTDMSMTPDAATGNPGRSYRYYTGTPVYEFGHGMSLTTFSMTNATAVGALVMNTSSDGHFDGELQEETQILQQSVTVKNTGEWAPSAVLVPDRIQILTCIAHTNTDVYRSYSTLGT